MKNQRFYSLRAAARRLGINHQYANNRFAAIEAQGFRFPRRVSGKREEPLIPEECLFMLAEPDYQVQPSEGETFCE